MNNIYTILPHSVILISLYEFYYIVSFLEGFNRNVLYVIIIKRIMVYKGRNNMNQMEFSFFRTPVIHFGKGSIKKLPEIAAARGKSILLVVSRSFKASEACSELIIKLNRESFNLYMELASGEPSPEMINSIVKKYRGLELSAIAGIGGGSVVDAGKAISAMLPSGEPVEDYLEGVGHKTHDGRKVFYIAVPTSSGTGAEATKNAVISRMGIGGYKKSLRHDSLVPDVAIVDPELAISCPKDATAACGLDALTQLVEAYTSVKASPMTDALCISGIKAVGKGFEEAYYNGRSIEAREYMAYGALMSGIVLANAGLGIVHGLASPIGGMFPIPHGVVCGTLLYEAVCTNIEKMLLEPQKYEEGLKKYSYIGEILAGGGEGSIQKGLASLKEVLLRWTELTGMPRLSEYGVREEHIDDIIRGAGNKNNPVKLGNESIKEIIMRRL